MIEILLLLISLLFAQGPIIGSTGPFRSGGNTFTLVNGTNFNCGNSSPCSISYTTTAGSLLEIVYSSTGGSSFITGMSGGGTWVIPSACQVSDTSAGSMSCAYVLSDTSTSSISLSFTSGIGGNGTLLEYSVSPGPPVLDQATSVDRSTSASSQNYISPTVTGSNDVILQGLLASQNINTFTLSGYTEEQKVGGYGSVGLANSTSATAPSVNLTSSGRASVCSLAFK